MSGKESAGVKEGQGGKPLVIKLLIAFVVLAVLLAVGWWGFSRFTAPEPEPPRPSVAERPAPAPAPAPEPAPVVEEEPGPMLPEPLVVNFRYRSYYLGKEGMRNVRDYLADLETTAGLSFTVDAYTCDKGSGSYNKWLSKKRALSVRQYLMKRGVPKSAITIAAHGEADPVASNKTESGRRQNRRATVTVTMRE